MNLLDLVPSVGSTIDWDTISRLPWFAAMRGVVQSPRFHREGDVETHVRMVCEELVAADSWRTATRLEREDLFLAALFHDCGKPATTRIDEDGSIHARGHARRGASIARRILWENGFPSTRRETIASLVRHHMRPHHLLERPDAERLVIEVAETTAWPALLAHAEADVLGRISDDREAMRERLPLLARLVEECGCAEGPFPFATDHARFLYLRGERARPTDPAWFEPKCAVTLLSGLPGAGKDHWIRENGAGRPVVSLDSIRTELGVDPEENQGRVVSAARDRAREHLRAGRDFIWNATNTSRAVRAQCIDLFARYGAQVEIVAIEVSRDALRAQNRSRAEQVPERVIERLVSRWEPPDRTEAHRVRTVEVSDAR